MEKTAFAPSGAAVVDSGSSSAELTSPGEALTALEFDSDTLPRPKRGGLPANVPMSALATLTLMALTIALIEKLQAATNDPTLIDDTITYKDLEHGTLLIAPKGGATKGVVLDDPELTIIVGAPEGGFVVQEVFNSSADMAQLLAAADAVHFIYQLGQADPFTTGSTQQRAESQLFFPDQPNIQLVSNPLPLLPPLGDNPNGNTGAPESANTPPPQQTFVVNFSIAPGRVLSHDETPGLQSGDTDDEIPNIDLVDLGNPPSIGRAQIGDATNPFITTTGAIPANFTVRVTVEASAEGVPSGLSVTGGGPIYLFTKKTENEEHQVVIGREGSANGAIAFIVYVKPDGSELWLQESLPIDHGDDGNDFDSVQSILDAALRVRITVSDGTNTLSQTIEIGDRIAFVDDGPTVIPGTTVFLDDETATATYGAPNTGGAGDYNGATTAGGTLGFSYGADGPGSVVFTALSLPETGGFSYVISPDGQILTIKQLQNVVAVDVIEVKLTGNEGHYTVKQLKPVFHPTSQTSEENVEFTVIYRVTDGDGDHANGCFKIDVDDDTPVAKNDTATVIESVNGDFKVAFVLDFSGSITNAQFNQQKEAVLAAGRAIFLGTTGDVSISMIAFASGAIVLSGSPFTTIAAFEAAINALNANSRGLSTGGTNYNAALNAVMTHFVPDADANNHVFFISDGNPSSPINGTTAAVWNNFVNGGNYDLQVTAIGVGIPTASLQAVDVDGNGTPISLAGIDGLIQTLLDQAGTKITGNVLFGGDGAAGGDDDDAFGADGGRILSITIDGVTYVWNGVLGAGSVIIPSTGSDITGTTLLTGVLTPEGGKLSFNFETGQWTYRVKTGGVDGIKVETFTYVIVDGDGDQASATLKINVVDVPNIAPVINALATMNYHSTNTSSNPVMPINRVIFQDADVGLGTDVTARFTVNNQSDTFTAPSAGGVTTQTGSGGGERWVELTGTMAEINAYLAGNNLLWNPGGLSGGPTNRTLTVKINDGHVTVDKTISIVHRPEQDFDGGSQSVNYAGWNFNDVDITMGSGGDTVVTSWSHGPDNDPVVYDGEGSGSDTVTVVFTPKQLEEILNDEDDREELDDFLDDPDDNDLTFGSTSWNAQAINFENAQFALAAGPGNYVIVGDNLPSFDGSPDSGADLWIGSNGGNTVNGGDGNDILVGRGGNDTLNGGSGNDLILGGAGEDVINGGSGNDILSGGAGADTFIFTTNPGQDTIVDYSFVEGDVLDLSGLLNFDAGDNPNAFVSFSQSNGNIVISVDTNGPSGGGTISNVITLAGYDSGGPDPIKIMLDNASMQTFTV